MFLVFNKIYSITETELESLTKRVDYDLNRLGLADKVDSKISYISAQKSFEVTLSGRSFSNDPLAILEKDIWTYLLEGDKAGIYRLLDVTHQVYKAYNDFSTILNTRLLDSAKLEELYSAIEEIKEKLPELRQMFESKGNSTLEKMKLFLDAEKHQLLWRLDKRLKTIPVDKAFPGDSDIKQYLISEIDAMIVRANQLCMQQVNLYKNDVDVWIEGNLKRLRGIINNNTQTQFMDLSPIETMIIPTIDFSAAFGMGILGGIIAVLINPYAAVGTVVATAAATFFGLLFFTAETRRAKRIVKVIESTRSRCDTVFEDIESKFSHGIREIFITIHNYTNERISLYFSDLSSQINKINTHRLSEEERELYKRCFNLLKEQESRLEKTVNELSRFK